MDSDRFWSLITGATESSLYDRLCELTPEEIIEFDRHFREHLARTWTWKIHVLASVVDLGPPSMDSFRCFRSWLPTFGKADFERILEDPDHLATLAPENLEEWYTDELDLVASRCIRDLTGREYFGDHPEEGKDYSGEPIPESMEAWAELCPRLWERYGAAIWEDGEGDEYLAEVLANYDRHREDREDPRVKYRDLADYQRYMEFSEVEHPGPGDEPIDSIHSSVIVSWAQCACEEGVVPEDGLARVQATVDVLEKSLAGLPPKWRAYYEKLLETGRAILVHNDS